MAFTTLVPFPYTMTPMGNISAPTYRDGTTYALELEQLKQQVNTVLVDGFNDGIANAIAEFQNGIANAEQTVTDLDTGWTTRYEAFIANFTNEVKLLNEAAVAGMVPAGAVHTALLTLIDAEITAATTAATTANHAYTDAQVDALAVSTATAATTLTGRVTTAENLLNDHSARHEYKGLDALAIDARQVKEPVRDWVRAGLETSATAPFRIVFTGDSHTQGGDKNYNVRLSNLLTKEAVGAAQGTGGATGNSAAGVHTWSAAWPGNVSGNYLTAGTVSNIATIGPELVFHMIGTNDFTNQVTPAAYKANILKGLVDVWTVAPNARQVLISVWPVTNPTTMTYAWALYETAMREIAEQYATDTRFALYDFGAKLTRPGSAASTPWAKVLFDGIHGGPDIHRALADELAVWVGLPNPNNVWGPTRTLVGSTIQNGVRLPSNVAASVTLEPAPVPRTVTIHAKALVTATAEAALYLQIDETDGTVLNFPHRVPAGAAQSRQFSMVLDVGANEKRIFSVAGEAGLSFVAGGDNDFYNQFWIDVSYS